MVLLLRVALLSLVGAGALVAEAQAPPASMRRVVPGDTSMRVSEIRADTLRDALT